MNLGIKNTTGISNDTEITVDGEKLAGVCEVSIEPIVLGNFITAHLKVETNFLDIETDKFTIETIDTAREKCKWNTTNFIITTDCNTKFGTEFDVKSVIFCPNCGLKIENTRK